MPGVIILLRADFEATLADVYGLDYEESLVIVGGVISTEEDSTAA